MADDQAAQQAAREAYKRQLAEGGAHLIRKVDTRRQALALSDRARLKLAATSEPIDHQRRSAPTTKDVVTAWHVDALGRSVAQRSVARRRKSERFFASLSAGHQRAAESLEGCWSAAVGPVRARVAQLENAGRTGVFARAEAEKKLRMAERFWVWAGKNTAARPEVLACIAVLCHGLTIREAEAAIGTRKGKGDLSDLILLGLDRWLGLNGG